MPVRNLRAPPSVDWRREERALGVAGWEGHRGRQIDFWYQAGNPLTICEWNQTAGQVQQMKPTYLCRLQRVSCLRQDRALQPPSSLQLPHDPKKHSMWICQPWRTLKTHHISSNRRGSKSLMMAVWISSSNSGHWQDGVRQYYMLNPDPYRYSNTLTQNWE